MNNRKFTDNAVLKCNIATYFGCIELTKSMNVVVPFFMINNEKKTSRLLMNLVVFEPDRRVNRSTKTCLMCGLRRSLQMTNEQVKQDAVESSGSR